MKYLNKLGPGLLYAGAAVGVSHIVQSTQAGALYGWLMVVFVVLANVLKYPFFEFGPRYAGATGKSLLQGYQQLGQWALITFLLITLLTMFIIQAAVTVVTAGLAVNLFSIDHNIDIWIIGAIVLGICTLLLQLGGFKLLDRLMKVIMVLLALTTVLAFALSFGANDDKPGPELSFDFSETAIAFLIAFMGWMPAPLDISVWHSVWAVEQSSNDGKKTLRSLLFDFKVGYWGTMILAILFVGLGTVMLYGSGIELQKGASAFAAQLISIYTDALGEWSYYLIAIAAFTTMFSTTLTCLDAFGRIISPVISRIQLRDEKASKNGRTIWLLLTSLGALVILHSFMENMGDLIHFITTLSFLAAPVIAFLNYRVIFTILDKNAQPSIGTKRLAWLGMAFMTGLSMYYLFFLIKN